MVYLKNTLYTRFLSVKVSNSEYMAFNMDTTSIGEIRLQISVKVTTSENKIDTLSNICKQTKYTRDTIVTRDTMQIFAINWV